MRVLFLTAGTGGFFCGACIRDNALVHALRRMGHEVHLMPLYLPTTLDEEDASDCPLFLGGINIWLQDKMSLFRHTPRFIDKIFDSSKLLALAGQRSGFTEAKELGHMTVAALHGLDGSQAKEIRRMQDWLRKNIDVDLVCFSNLLLLGLGPAIKEVFDVPQVATMQSEESFIDSLPDEDRDETWSLLRQLCQRTNAFIGISHFHANLMEERLELKRDRIYVVYNGLDLNGFTCAVQRPTSPVIGYLSRMHPSKGLHTLVDAFIMLSDNIPEARLCLIGSKTQSEVEYVAEQEQKIAESGLTERVEWHCNVTREEKTRLLKGLSVLSVPTTYPEGFGLYIIEALACGVPVILPDRGSFPEIVGDTEGGVIYSCAPGHQEVDILARTLKEYLPQKDLLTRLGREGHEAVLNRYDIDSMAAGIQEAFQDVVMRES